MMNGNEDGKKYVGYAQKVPQIATSYDNMDFAIIFLVQESVMYGF